MITLVNKACMFADWHVPTHPLVITVQHVHLLFFTLLSTISDWFFLLLLWHSWWGRRTFEGTAPNKSGKVWVTFCDAFPTKPPTMPYTPRQPFNLWLMASPIVGTRACDLLIKFVFTPTEQVGHTTVTHGADVVPSQTAQSEKNVFCVHL